MREIMWLTSGKMHLSNYSAFPFRERALLLTFAILPLASLHERNLPFANAKSKSLQQKNQQICCTPKSKNDPLSI